MYIMFIAGIKNIKKKKNIGLSLDDCIALKIRIWGFSSCGKSN